MKYNYRMQIAYDGTPFHGWQIQLTGLSIQEILQNCLAKIIRHPITVIGSGRTDSGVHAVGQVAHFKTHHPLDISKVFKSINSLLPKEIRVLSLENAPIDFHAQFNAVRKTYHYNLFVGPVQPPLERLYALHIYSKIDLNAMQEAAQFLLGEHDFTSFANESHRGSAAEDPVRTMERIDFVQSGGNVRIEFQGNGFLYKMVRNCVGTLLEVGTGKRKPADIISILEARDRRQAGQAAPPHGLFLFHVDYGD